MWCVFFAMGCYLRKCGRRYRLFLPIAITLAGMLVQYAETYYLNVTFGGGFGIKFSSFVYSMAVIMLLFSARIEQAYNRNAISRAIEHIGGISFAVYLYHCFVIGIFCKLQIYTETPWIARWAASLAATIAVISILKRILPRKYSWMLGVN